jgi:hypothetical protein
MVQPTNKNLSSPLDLYTRSVLRNIAHHRKSRLNKQVIATMTTGFWMRTANLEHCSEVLVGS